MKYIIDVPDEVCSVQGVLYDYSVFSVDMTPYTEPDRKAIEDAQEETWELARNLVLCVFHETGEFTIDEIKDCFGSDKYLADILKDFSYQEAKAKYEAWKKQKDEIRVGDEVIPMDTQYDTMIVTRTWKDDYWRECIDTVGFDGSICSFLQCKVKKTGRHFDEVEELLKEMRKKP